MKKTLYIIMALCFTALAVGAEAQGVKISDARTTINGETLDLDLKIEALGLELKSDGMLKLELALENEDRRLILLSVVYAGGQRYRYLMRENHLSNDYRIKPYAIYKNDRNDRAVTTHCHLTIPYYSWMEHATIIWREYTNDCEGLRRVHDGVLIADLNPPPVVVEPEIWQPDPALFAGLVGFLVPEVEEVKARASMIELNINFPVNVTEVRPDYMDNHLELNRADSLVRSLEGNDLLDIRGVGIRGYASPDGRYTANERLAKGRSEAFRQYLTLKYPSNQYIRNANTTWVAEDFEGLARLVAESDLPNKQEVLAVVLDDSMAPDTKEQVLQKIGQWSQVYKRIMEDFYPKLRRIELRVDYTIRNLTDGEARELLYTDPGMLSLDEIYRVARYYEPDSRQYREVYEIAARQYPQDVIANNNAAAAFLQDGNAEQALRYLEKSEGNPMSLINYGAYHYITGNLDTAIAYFTRAKEAGVVQAEHNLSLIDPAK